MENAQDLMDEVYAGRHEKYTMFNVRRGICGVVWVYRPSTRVCQENSRTVALVAYIRDSIRVNLADCKVVGKSLIKSIFNAPMYDRPLFALKRRTI